MRPQPFRIVIVSIWVWGFYLKLIKWRGTNHYIPLLYGVVGFCLSLQLFFSMFNREFGSMDFNYNIFITQINQYSFPWQHFSNIKRSIWKWEENYSWLYWKKKCRTESTLSKYASYTENEIRCGKNKFELNLWSYNTSVRMEFDISIIHITLNYE